jgi:hypothetical protein
MINEMIGGPALSKDIFYTSTKNGGLGLRLLTERYQACTYNTATHFYKEMMEQENLSNVSSN